MKPFLAFLVVGVALCLGFARICAQEGKISQLEAIQAHNLSDMEALQNEIEAGRQNQGDLLLQTSEVTQLVELVHNEGINK